MKTTIVSMIFGALALPLAAQGPTAYYKLSLRGDCQVQVGGIAVAEQAEVENDPIRPLGPGGTYRRTRLSTLNLITALLAEARINADPRRCYILAGVNPWSDLGVTSWYLYCNDRGNSWKYRIDSDVLRMSRGDKSASVWQQRGSRNGTSTRSETSFVRFDFDTDLLDHFATLYTVMDMRSNGGGPVPRGNNVERVPVKGGIQSFRLSGNGHHRTRIPDVDGSCPGRVSISLNGQVSNEDFENADHRGTIGGDPD